MFGKLLVKKLKEATLSVVPVTMVVFVLLFALGISSMETTITLFVSALLLTVGIALFLTGVDASMVSLGSSVGGALSKNKNLFYIILASFVIGFIITVAEPDLSVLATQVEGATSLSSTIIFLIAVSLGVGVTFSLGVIKMKFKLSYAAMLTILYALLFAAAVFVPKTFVLLSFDAGAVTTGALSVPFMLAFGVGFCAIRSKSSQDEGLGLLGLASIGPIVSTMFLSLFIEEKPYVSSYQGLSDNLLGAIFNSFTQNIAQTAIVILPLLVLFIVCQIFVFKYPKVTVVRMSIGFALTFVGITIFLTGVDWGYLPIAHMIGQTLYQIGNNALSIGIGVLLGALAVMAEPALSILKKQMEEITSGRVKGIFIYISIVLGVAAAGGIAMLSTLYNINIIFVLLPLYVISIMLSFCNTNLFSSMAFDSGGIATGTMSVTFILPLVSAISLGGGGFGTIALIAVFPILTVQLFGLVYKLKLVAENKKQLASTQKNKLFIVDFDYKRRK